MQSTENSKRGYFTKEAKMTILEELKTSGMTISNLARKHGIHPVTVHKWKREMGTKKQVEDNSSDTKELLKEIEKIKQDNENLKKALADIAVENQVFKTANEILKKNQLSEKFKSPKKSSKKSGKK